MNHQLDPDNYRRLLAIEADRLVDVETANLSNEIPHIEGWTVHSTIGHTAWVQRYVTLCLAADPEHPPSRSKVGEPPVGPDVIDWYREATAMAADALSGDLDAMHPTWTGPQDGHWWLRRLSQEVAMHRWDVQSAMGHPDPIDADLARDGIDEVLDVFVPNRLQFDRLDADGRTIHLHATDAEHGEWLIHVRGDNIEWERGHAKGDVAARGPMSDLLLLLWSRIPAARLEVFGDEDLLVSWQDAARF